MKPEADEEIREHAARLREVSPQPEGCDCSACRREQAIRAEVEAMCWDETVEF